MTEKYLFASDIHGDSECTGMLLEAFEREKADRLLLLGDILYHGPRNDLPEGYDPKAVIRMLNGMKDRISSVRGNCDAEVDGMVLAFPIDAEDKILTLGERTVYITHGHHAGAENPKGVPDGCVLVTGHTHIWANEELERGIHYLNPGSVSIPKGGKDRSYMLYDGSLEEFSIRSLSDGRVLSKYKISR